MDKAILELLGVVVTTTVLVVFSAAVGADSLDLIVGSKHTVDSWKTTTTHRYAGGSYQTTEYTEFNENNLGLGYNADNGFSAGFYDNSFNKTSVYAGATFQTQQKYLNVGITVGGITGYEHITGMTVTPMAMPFVTAGTETVKVKVGYIPGAFTFSLNFEL